MQCHQCQHENASDAKFCNQCATPFTPVCSACGHENPADAKFCNQCTTLLNAPQLSSATVLSSPQEVATESRLHALIPAVTGWLQRERRVTYRTLKYVLSGLDEAMLEEIRRELAFKELAIDKDGEGLVWIGEDQLPSDPLVSSLSCLHRADTATDTSLVPSHHTEASTLSNEPIMTSARARSAPEAERRQLTVMFCDLVGSTDLSGKLDPEYLREVVRAYQETAAEVIQRYEGHVAQYLGDGLLIYFGFPVAHEDDAQRAVYTGLGILEAMGTLNIRLEKEYGVQLAVRIGIHTGPVVVGEMGGGGHHEILALGETPNIAARLEGLAQPNTAVVSPVTAQLVQRSFILEELGPHELKGVAETMMLYTVVAPRESERDDHGEMLSGGFDALVGRDEEIGLLLRRWEQTQEGQGQVVMISGEAGLGKSSLVEGLRARVHQEGYTRMAFRCSPYTANSALHPVIEHLQRVLDWQREDPNETKLSKLDQVLHRISLPLEETVPLVASLLSLPLPEGRYPALTLSPQQQRQQTQDLLVAWLLEEAERQPLLAIWEDLHWADPSTLELLGLFIEQCATVSMMNVLAYRPEFTAPWPNGSHLTPLTLNRLERTHIEALVSRLAGEKALPGEVVQHVVSKTDGVPLYVEELTKMLLESELLQEEADQYVLTGPLSDAAIPATLQDSLMARLDRLPLVKEVAQLGAVLGREFAYEMLHALAAVEEPTLQNGLGQLVETELLYQRGRIPRAKYIFRHALIRDAAYESLLLRTRQQVHQQVADLLEVRFPEVVETQPELVAHHYTEAGCPEPAITYWLRAGQQAAQRSAHQEAIGHLTQGLALLATQPDTPERRQQELAFQTTLGPALMVTKGYGHPEVEQVYARARALCQQVGETPALFPVLYGLWMFYRAQGALQTARELGEQLLTLAQHEDDPSLRLAAYVALGSTLYFLGDFAAARLHLEHGIAEHRPDSHRAADARYGNDPGVQCYNYLAWTLWYLGYPDQALHRSHEEQTLAQALAHPATQVFALYGEARIRHHRRDVPETQELAEALITLTTEQGDMLYLAYGTNLRSWTLLQQGQHEEAIDQMHQGLAAIRTGGGGVARPTFLALLAEAYGTIDQADKGLSLLAEARTILDQNGQRYVDAELYRIEGELRLHQTKPEVSEAARCFHHALDVACQQQAKSPELRAAMSLSRLWQSQDKCQEAYDLLAPIYEWFTEGFDTADLQDAKALLSELRAESNPLAVE